MFINYWFNQKTAILKPIPALLIDSTALVYQQKFKKRSSIVYNASCLLILGTLVSSYYFLIPVSVKATAIIRPSAELSSIRSLISGRIRTTYVRENQVVKKGDNLFVIASEVQDEQKNQLMIRRRQTELYLKDLNSLISGANVEAVITPLYRQSYVTHLQKLADATTILKKAQTDYNRSKVLYDQLVIAAVDFEKAQFDLERAESELAIVKQSQINAWQSEMKSSEEDLREINGQLAKIEKENNNTMIQAPISGTIQNLSGVYAGSTVFANQDIAQISPDTSLVVDAYVDPSDIGLIIVGMPVRFQVSAFNYNQWGLATGRVLEVSNDIQINKDKPFFKVRCELDKNYLQLKSGYKGFLKKGMTLQARFVVTDRTLWQLLYDKMDDWLNPDNFQK